MTNRNNRADALGRERGTVGAIMWERPVVLPPQARMNEAIERLRQVGLPQPGMNSCYVVAEDYTLLGILGLRDMLLTRGGVRVETAMARPFVTVQPEDDQELAAQLMEEFDILELPVVDDENRPHTLRGLLGFREAPAMMPWASCRRRPRRTWR